MRKKTVIMTKNLPAIQKASKSNQNSPRGLVSPLSCYSLLGDCTVKKTDEIKKPVFLNITANASIAKIENETDLSKHVSEEEVKKEAAETSQDTTHLKIVKNEPEFKREFRLKKPGIEQGLMNNLKTIQEQQRYIDTLLSENNELKVRLKGLEDTSNKITQNWHLSESSLKSYQDLLKSSDNKVKELHSAVAYKESEILEVKDMLKKSETKRRVATEQMSEVETKMNLLQRQVAKLNSQISLYEQDLARQEKTLNEKNSQILELNKEIQNAQQLLECENNRRSSESAELCKANSSLISQIEEQKVKIEILDNENLRLQEALNHFQGDTKKTTVVLQRKSDTSHDSKFINDITKEEASRWHSRYFALEEELSSFKGQLEKHKKNEAYYREQLNCKNSMISRLETLIKENEKVFTEADSEVNFPVAAKNAEFMVKELMEVMSSVKEHFCCCNCFRLLSKGFACVPCGHVICEDCTRNSQVLCGGCAEKVNAVLDIKIIEKLSECYSRHTTDLEKLLEILIANVN